jgi:RsiW-degrading membrane proteinase PrsW (M82 family)
VDDEASDAHTPPPDPAARGPYPVPPYARQPQFPAMPASPQDWRYHPPATPSWWHRHRGALRVLTVVTLLTLCGLTIFALVREQTGTVGLFVGLGLAVLPVPLLLAAFRWLDGVEPSPWRNHVFAFAYGACAATLVAITTSTLAMDWLNSSLPGSPGRSDRLGGTVVAPLVEETTKGTAVLLLFLFRRRDFDGVISGLVIAGITATGFAFTENVLYLGTAFGEDQMLSPDGLPESVTAATFFTRIVIAPFAHPLFTAMTGLGLGIVAALRGRGLLFRITVPLLGLLTAVLLHSIWNSSSTLPGLAFLAVYALFMCPVFALLTWLAIWSRHNELRTVRDTLPSYAAAGWLDQPEPWAIGSMRARAMARGLARRAHGAAGARTVAEYQHFATSLALLRARAQFSAPPADFQAREQELLHHLWHRRPLAGPPTTSAALALARPRVPPHWGGNGNGGGGGNGGGWGAGGWGAGGWGGGGAAPGTRPHPPQAQPPQPWSRPPGWSPPPHGPR